VYSQTRPCGVAFGYFARRVVRGLPVHIAGDGDRRVAEQVVRLAAGSAKCNKCASSPPRIPP
jgi:hypothetical protein